MGGYNIEGTDNVDECPNDGGCSGPFYYSGPERWYPDTDLDNLAYGANYPLLQDGIGYCGRYEGGVLIPGSKPPATDAISNWIWFCPSEYLVTYGDVDTLGNCGTTGYPNCNEPFCNYDPHPDCTSNVVDECGICDGLGGGICGCGEQPPVPMVMDFDDNGIGYGYFWNNIWNNDNFLQACKDMGITERIS